MKLHYFQHVPFEGLGNIETWAQKNKIYISSTRFFEPGAAEPALDYDFLVVMGGPMNVDEENIYPWLKDEKIWIEKAIRAGKKVLGICLGAQLIARVLGSLVYKNPRKEIGWWPVIWAPEAAAHPAFSAFTGVNEVFHWHGDTFDLPSGCEHAAKSEACLNQAFFYGENTAGLQFHLESTPDSVRLLADHCADEIVDAPFVQSREEILGTEKQFKNVAGLLENFLNGFFLKKETSV